MLLAEIILRQILKLFWGRIALLVKVLWGIGSFAQKLFQLPHLNFLF